MPRDYYDVLDVGRDADAAEVKRAFRRLARELHPDVNADGDAEERFKEAAEAYEVLSDSERRAAYDRFGHEGLRARGFEPHAGFGSFEDILGAFFGQGFSAAGAAGPRDGGDIAAAVEVDLSDVLTGTTKQVEVEAATTCERCDGDGAEPGAELITCPRCGGAGRLQAVSRTMFGQMVRQATCDECRGAGKIPEEPCSGCGGEGREMHVRSWDVEVPAGIEAGQRIRITRAGHAGEPGGSAGHLYVDVHVAPDERFVREGTDLVHVLDLPATAAMVGDTVEVPTLDGVEEVEIDPGTQPGAQVVLRGRGLPELRSQRRGALRVLVNVVVPRGLDDEQRDLARRLGDTLTERNLRHNGDGGLFDRLKRVLS